MGIASVRSAGQGRDRGDFRSHGDINGMAKNLLIAVALLAMVAVVADELAAEPNTTQVVIDEDKSLIRVQGGLTYLRTTPIDKASDPIVGTWIYCVATPDVPSSLVIKKSWTFTRDGKVDYSDERLTRGAGNKDLSITPKARGRWERNRTGILVTWDK
ncbi:MAG: hypothetical protein HY319_18700 [Armatimonadetes bacterium]|nr:hypothetical protein [Armatimonadota bacterium]